MEENEEIKGSWSHGKHGIILNFKDGEGKDAEVLTEHETPEDFWLGKTVEGTWTFYPNLNTHEICMHLLERIEELELSLIEMRADIKHEVKKDIRRPITKGDRLTQVREILLAAAHPLHINEIFSELDIPIDPVDKYPDITKVNEMNRLIGRLNYYCKKKNIFVKKGRNVFGLIEREK